jgi:hypothetical protein
MFKQHAVLLMEEEMTEAGVGHTITLKRKIAL